MKKILVVGSLNMDSVVYVDHAPRVGETIVTQDIRLNPGGKGANQAYAAAKLGADVSILGAVGDDAFGKALTDNLKAVGVDTDSLCVLKDSPSGQAFITVNRDGDNSIVVISGANARFSIDDIDRRMDYLREADILLLQLEIDPSVVQYTIKKAKELGKLVILDPAPARNDLPDELFRHVDILKPNETELSMLTGVDDILNHLEEATSILLEKGVKNVIVTLGGNGAFLNSRETGIVRISGNPVSVVDTTAAGDTFTSAVAVELAKGRSLPEAIRTANAISALVVTKPGAQESIPSEEEARKLGIFSD